MKITLTQDEITKALMKVIEEKTNHTIGECNEDECFFTIYNEHDVEIYLGSIEFTCTFF